MLVDRGQPRKWPPGHKRTYGSSSNVKRKVCVCLLTCQKDAHDTTELSVTVLQAALLQSRCSWAGRESRGNAVLRRQIHDAAAAATAEHLAQVFFVSDLE